jgi:hypothetical protein
MDVCNITSKNYSIILTGKCGHVDMAVRISPEPLNTIISTPQGLFVPAPDFTSRTVTLNAGLNIVIPEDATQSLADNPSWTISVDESIGAITPWAIYANSWFDDGDPSFVASGFPVRIGDTFYNIINDYTNRYSTYTKVTHHGNGPAAELMTDDLVDGFIYRKKYTEYFKLNYEQYSIRLFGAVGDGVTDDRQAILNAIKYVPRDMDTGPDQPSPGAMIWVPRGTYYCSDEIRVGRVCHFMGESGFLGSNVKIVFATNKNGFEIMRYDSEEVDENCDEIAYDGSRAADGTIFENLSIVARNPGDGTRGYGVKGRAEFVMVNCNVVGFKYAGVYIAASAAVPPLLERKLKMIYVAYPGTSTYIVAPAVVITPNHGSSAHAVLGGAVSGITVTDEGEGYFEVPYVRVKEDGGYNESNILTRGYGCDAVAHMGINTIAVRDGGGGYTTATVVITSPDGSGATAHAVILAGAISAIIVDTAGLNYLLIDDITVTVNGNGTGAIAEVADLKLVDITLRSGGINYEDTDIPLVFINGGRRGTGHDATAVVDGLTNRHVKRIEIDDAGDNEYCTPPDITLVGGPGDATAWAATFGSESGNANRWKLVNCRFNNNGYGLLVVGSDVNAGYAIGVNASENGLYGIWDNSFLGNTYLNLHTATNGWGPYLSTSNTAKNVFLNCYSEGNQKPSVAINPARFIEGIHGAGIAGSAKVDGTSALSVTRQGAEGGIDLAIGGNLGNNELLSVNSPNQDEAGTMRWLFNQESLDMSMTWYNAATNRNWVWTGTNTPLTFGRGDTVPYAVYNQQLFVGPTPTGARQITSSSVFPPTRSSIQQGWAKGDFVINTDPSSSNGLVGWSRLTTGTNDVLDTDWMAVIIPVTGSFTGSGNGSTTVFNIAHGLDGTPTYWNVTAASSAAASISYVTANATNLIVNYGTAPPSGSNNITIKWQARL